MAVAFLLYQTVILVFFPRGLVELQAFHLSFAFTLVYGYEALRAKRPWRKLLFTAMLVASVAATMYLWVFEEGLEWRIGFPDPLDNYVGLFLLFTVFLATQRSWGWVLPIIAGVGVLYAFFGQSLPAGLGAPDVRLDYVLNYQWLSRGRIDS